MNENGQPVSKFMKFVQFPVIRIVLGFATLVLIPGLFQLGTQLLVGREGLTAEALTVLVTTVTAFLAYYGFVRLIERRSVSELSLSHALKELVLGALLGGFLFSTTIGILWMLGYYQVSALNSWTEMVSWFLTGVISGTLEELLIRGVLFRIMEETLGTWIALIISALIFGALHLANPNATLWAGLAIAIEAGVMLAAAYVYTRRLWLPIGIHFAWNFVQGGIFGVSVSGIEAKGFLQSTLSGPALLSGGEFGAEASIFAVIVCLAAGIYFVWRSYTEGKFIQPYWNRRYGNLS
jgi:membrane protease YdiL (CAAX protease family)